MTREEKILSFAKERDAKILQAEAERQADMLNLLGEIHSELERTKELIHLAQMCKANGISLGENQDNLHSNGIKSKCFISNGWSHHFGFNRELTALGFYNGGYNGNTDMFLFENGTIEYPTSENHIFRDGLVKWLDNFDRFEEAFLNYIDTLK